MSNNKIILTGCIEQFKCENELTSNDGETFELFCLSQLTKTYDPAFEDIRKSIVDGGMDGGVDSLLVVIDDIIPDTVEDLSDIVLSRNSVVSIIISQCKRENSFKESALDKLITTIPELFDLTKKEEDLLERFNPDLVDRALLARECWKKCSSLGGKLKIFFYYCTNAETNETNSAFAAKIKQLKKQSEKLFSGAEVKYRNLSSAELLELQQIQKNQRLSIKYKESPLSTSYLSSGSGYVGTVKLADYKRFLEDDDRNIRDDLFESNIRHYQGSVDVNMKIAETIKDSKEEDFWWLNNGITIIASNPSLVGTTLSLDNVRIVNGLQTSYSIFLNHDGDEEDTRSVLVKVIINENKSTIDHVIASTNSQNPVSPAVLRATDKIQRDLELFFLTSGFFYDRRKNYYKNQGRPVGRIFSVQTAAQAIESVVHGNPSSARSKPTSLIKDDSAYSRIFNPDIDFRVYLNCCLIHKKTVEFWGEMSDRDKKVKLSNFKFHLSRIAASFVVRSATYTPDEISTIDLTLYDQDRFDQACGLLLETIDAFQSASPDSNLINMAKAKGLTDSVIKRLTDTMRIASNSGEERLPDCVID